jgi:hypothetical protein
MPWPHAHLSRQRVFGGSDGGIGYVIRSSPSSKANNLNLVTKATHFNVVILENGVWRVARQTESKDLLS